MTASALETGGRGVQRVSRQGVASAVFERNQSYWAMERQEGWAETQLWAVQSCRGGMATIPLLVDQPFTHDALGPVPLANLVRDVWSTWWVRRLAGCRCGSLRVTDAPAPPRRVVLAGQREPRTLRVESVREDKFSAVLSEAGIPDRRITFPRRMVASADAGMLRPGSVFYWSNWWEQDETGERRFVQALRFRRHVEPSAEDLDQARVAALDLLKRLGAEPVDINLDLDDDELE